MAIAAIAAFAVFVPTASADIHSTVTGVFSNDASGGHGDYTNTQTFTYDATSEDLRKWVVDSPPGLYGNPNAIPYAQRCSQAQFNTVIDPGPNPADPGTGANDGQPPFFNACPLSSKVGVAAVNLNIDANGAVYDANGAANPATGRLTGNIQDFGNIYLASTFANGVEFASLPAAYNDATPGTIYILQTEPEIPTTLGTQFYLTGSKTRSVLAPVTNQSGGNNGDSDFRIRTVPADDTVTPAGVHISGILQHLNGLTQASDPFLTNPTRCDDWTSYSYVDKVGGNSGGDSAPAAGEGTVFRKSAPYNQTPDCSTLAPFKTTASSSLTTGERGAYPGLTVNVGDSTPIGDDTVKKLVTALPEAVSVNVNALNNVCSVAQRDAEACPAAAQIGTATISTPLISAGLTGKVYMTASPNKTLPYLSIFVDGAIKFRLDATTRFIGPKFNIIETTFDQLPQSPFTNFKVDIVGGNSQSSLLFNRQCPTDGATPEAGSMTYSLTGWTGAVANTSTTPKFGACYGIDATPKSNHCKKQSKAYKFAPTGVVDKEGVAKIQLLTGTKTTNMKTRATDSKSPFAFKLTLKKSKFKKNTKYYYGYKVWYKDGKVIKSKPSTFKTCK